jgi:lipid II:glycine glycyltransferase (peptidoglycan interpeptide bridge formation enzyme)
MEQGFKLVNRDISSAVDLRQFSGLSSLPQRSRYEIKKAQKKGLTHSINENFNDYWSLMDKTFNKHGVKPTHSKEQLQYLVNKFPDDIIYRVAYYEETPIAGLCEFVINQFVTSSFYFCSDPEYKQMSGLSYLIYESLSEAHKKNFNWYDFGTSTVNMVGRRNIFQFKEGFGATGCFRDSFECEI